MTFTERCRNAQQTSGPSHAPRAVQEVGEDTLIVDSCKRGKEREESRERQEFLPSLQAGVQMQLQFLVLLVVSTVEQKRNPALT